MQTVPVTVGSVSAVGYSYPAGPVNCVSVVSPALFLGCGLFNVLAYDRFNFAAARMRRPDGRCIENVTELLDAEVAEANAAALRAGLTLGLTGRAALELLNK